MNKAKLTKSYQELRIHFINSITDPEELEQQLEILDSDYIAQLSGYRLLP